MNFTGIIDSVVSALSASLGCNVGYISAERGSDDRVAVVRPANLSITKGLLNNCLLSYDVALPVSYSFRVRNKLDNYKTEMERFIGAMTVVASLPGVVRVSVDVPELDQEDEMMTINGSVTMSGQY